MRSLIARDGKNLMMAGRNLSADQLALSSARVSTTATMMGQAAGIAAAMAVSKHCDPRDLNPADVRRVVIERGAKLDYIQAYTRHIPRIYDPAPIISTLKAGLIQSVMLSSFAAFENLVQMLGEDADACLNSAQLVVPGKRIEQKIRAGYPFSIRVAKNASDQEMLAATK